MTNCKYLRLTDICKPKQWKTISMSELSDSGYLCYGANGVIGHYKEYNHEDETIMIGCRGSCGGVNISKPKSYINGNAMCLESVNSQILKKYLYFALKSVDFKKIITGSSQPQITIQGLSKVYVKVYDQNTQKYIVDVLEKCDEIIKQIVLLYDKYNLLIKSQFVEMFGNLKTNTKNWPTKSLSDIATFYNGLTYSPEDVNFDGTIVLRSSNIQNGSLNLNDVVRVSCPIKQKYYVCRNDILMCSRNGSSKLVGKVAIINQVSEPMAFGAFMMIIRTKYPSFLKTYFEFPLFREEIKTGKTTTINQVTNKMLADIQIPYPDENTLILFSHLVDYIDKSKLINVF